MNCFEAYKSEVLSHSCYEWYEFIFSLEDFIRFEGFYKEFCEKHPLINLDYEDEFLTQTSNYLIDLTLNSTSIFSLDHISQFYIEKFKSTLLNISEIESPFNTISSNFIIDTPEDKIIQREILNLNYDLFKQINNIKKELETETEITDKILKFIKGWTPWDIRSELSKREKKLVTSFELDQNLYEILRTQPELLNTLDWRIFEMLLADILKTFNYEVELTKQTKDGGIDIIAIKRDTDFGLQKYILQAKRYSNKVGVEPVQRLFYNLHDLRATKICLATTAGFTKGAWDVASKYRWQLELKDFKGLHEWINRAIQIKKNK